MHSKQQDQVNVAQHDRNSSNEKIRYTLAETDPDGDERHANKSSQGAIASTN